MSQKQWGNITWILFHSLAESVNPNYFNQAKPLILNFINLTCENLPCPICSNHAKDTLSKAYLNQINSKADLIEFLRQFHNIVNIQTDKPIVNKEEVIKIYKRPKLNEIINKFIEVYSVSYGNFHVSAMVRSNNRSIFVKNSKNLLKEICKYCI